VAYQPSPDAIDEITLVTGNAPAEFGNYQGALVNVTLKSGGNRLRGSAFAYVRDDALNAVNWARKWQPLDPLNPSRKTPLQHNVFGGTVGGPIVRNRIFFFGDYQGTRREVGPLNSLLTFITPEMRRGDFSALLRGSNPQQLYDPFSAQPDPSNPNSIIRDPFPNNQVPLDRINPVAANLFANAYYPVPDLPGLVSNTWNRTSTTLDNDQFDVKVDAKPGARDDLSARYAWACSRSRPPTPSRS